MKKYKKIFTIIFSLIIVMSLSITAVAADTIGGDTPPTTPMITVPAVGDNSAHTYDVYQVLKGEVERDSNSLTVLTDALWGKNAVTTDESKIADAIKELQEAQKLTTDIDKLKIIKKYVDLTSERYGRVSAGNPLEVEPGYYVIVDKGHDGNGQTAAGEGLSLYITQIVGNVEISPKKGHTTSEKKVQDDEANTQGWNDSADYDIGDQVPFKLSAIITDDYANYTHGYKLTFHDTLSSGLTLIQNLDKDKYPGFKDSIEVKIGEKSIDEEYYEVKIGDQCGDKCSFEVVFSDLKQIQDIKAGSKIDVYYKAILNENAVIGANGNPNKSHITYTNNPNDEQAGENGKTVEDTVIVFTYELEVNKYANEVSEDNKLKGAEFSLYKGDTLVKTITGTDSSTFTFSGLDAGLYTLKETKTPEGYNTMKDMTIEITATHTLNSSTPALESLTVTPANAFTVDKSAGKISGNIINYSGATLPTTGGMGTTIIYIIGGVMVVGASLLLITKRRMRGANR